jgi:PAS domain S-box-containing protein
MEPSGGIKTLLSSVTDAVVLVDSDRKVSFMNPEAVNLTGLSFEEAEGKDLWDVCVFIDQKSRLSVTDEINRVLSRDGYFNFPVSTVIIHQDGYERLVRGSVFLSDDTGKGSDSIEGLVFRNVSSRWLIDPAQQKNQKTETIRILAGGISDRLNDLLTVLLARMAGISRNHTDRATVFRSIRDAKKIIGRIGTMVSSLSPRTGDADTGNDVCLVNSILTGSINILGAVFPGLELRLAYPDRTGYAGVPPGLVEQIVINLLTNAAEAVDGNGTIEAGACRLELREDILPIVAGNYVIIFVRDNGCGIPDENLTRVFDPFYSTKREKGGLGLSAVYSIVNSHNGYIVIDSELGKGSSFEVFLPAAEKIVTETADDIFPSVYIAGFQEDEAEYIELILESLGCIVYRLTADNLSSEPAAPDDEIEDFNILLTDYDFYMSEIEHIENSSISEKGVIAVVSESHHVPDNPDPGIQFISRPLKIESIAIAVTLFAWVRHASEKDDNSED